MLDIEEKVIGYLAPVEGLEKAYDFEPERLRMPCTTLLFAGYDPNEAETGSTPDAPVDDVSYSWRLRLYVPLTDYERGQRLLKTLVPLVHHAIRSHPTCDDLCDFLSLRDPGGVPTFNHEDGWLAKDWLLRAVRAQP